MRITCTQYTSSSRSLDIYVSGCKPPHCSGCHNPELFDFSIGRHYNNSDYINMLGKIEDFGKVVKNIMIYGGEPLDQDLKELENMIELLIKAGKPIWLFTKYNLEEVPEFVKEKCDYIKCGRYDDTKLSNEYEMYGIKIASTNQIIYKKGKDY